MLRLRLTLLLGVLLALGVSPTLAQQSVSPCVRTTSPSPSGGCIPVSAANPLPISPSAAYPTGSTPITGNSTGTTGAVVGTLTSATGKTAYICGFSVSAIGGTAAVGPITIANTVTGSLVYNMASAVAGNTLSVNFTPCIPASATATNITVTTTADGTATAVAVNSWGFRL